jgi:acyl-CoA thioesterase YciA
MSELAGFELITRRLCLVKDTGHAGVLWGGTMMAWVDEAGAIYAGRRTRNPYIVTKAFTGIDFKHQVRPGDMVDFWGKVIRWGHSSVTIELEVVAWRPESNDRREVLRVEAVFVAIDPDGRKQRIVPADDAGSG